MLMPSKSPLQHLPALHHLLHALSSTQKTAAAAHVHIAQTTVNKPQHRMLIKAWHETM